MMSKEFCRYCGASIPKRDGEGTCERCDPEGVAANCARFRDPDAIIAEYEDEEREHAERMTADDMRAYPDWRL